LSRPSQHLLVSIRASELLGMCASENDGEPSLARIVFAIIKHTQARSNDG
jgi:hypothetical protein